MDEGFIKAFSEVIREQISNKHEVTVEGIGVFKAKHENQHQQKFQDGRVALMPPKDTVVFVPDSKLTHG